MTDDEEALWQLAVDERNAAERKVESLIAERDAAVARAEAAECDVVALRRQWNELDKRNEKRHREWSEQLSIVTDELVALRMVAEAARKLVPWPYLNAQDTYLVPLSNALSALAATPAAQETGDA